MHGRCATYKRRGDRKGKFYDTGAGRFDLIALKIAKAWHKDPMWFYSLDKDVQISLIAEMQLSNETKEDRDKRRENHARNKNKKRI